MVFNLTKRHLILSIVILTISTRLCAQDWNGLRFLGHQTGKTTFNSTEIKDVFKAKYTFWQNKLPVIICLPQSQSEEAKEICEKIYGKSVDEVKKFWLAQVFQGRSRSPQFFNTPEEMASFIAKTPGAIGVVRVNSNMQLSQAITLQVN